MKLEQIEERMTLFPDYLKTTIDNSTRGQEITWWDMIKPALRQPIQTFDQWLYSHRHYDLVDFDNWDPYTPIGKPIFMSTLGEADRFDHSQMWDMWNETGFMIIDSPKTNLSRYFTPAYGVAVDPYGGYNEHPSEIYRFRDIDNKRMVEYQGRPKSTNDFHKDLVKFSKFYGIDPA